MTTPARFWHRYAAWTLDAVPIALVAAPFVAGRVAAAAQALDRDLLSLMTVFYRQLDAALGGQAVASPQSLFGLASDAALRHAIDAVQADLMRLAAPPVLAFALIGVVYHVGFECSRRRATPGKRALGLRVTGPDGRGPSPGRALARYTAGALSWLTLNLGHALAAVPPQRRALHDRLAGTHVVAESEHVLPTWARGWLIAQAAVAVVATAVLAWHWMGLVQTALLQALG